MLGVAALLIFLLGHWDLLSDSLIIVLFTVIDGGERRVDPQGSQAP